VFVDDAAALLGVSRRTIYYRIREGRLRTIRTRGGSQRILLESIDALLREREAKQAARRAASETEALSFQVETLS
jgi:excisionase family DNA binding protein